MLGLFLIPIYMLYEVLGWRGRKVYVPTAAMSGMAFGAILAEPLSVTDPALWQELVICGSGGAMCGAVFSWMLARHRKRRALSALAVTRGGGPAN